jgi:ABC-type Fe3+-hydroxamate transport system substrate-binding protein
MAAFMGPDRHARAQKAVTTFQERYAAIQEQMKPKPRPKKPAQHRTARRSPKQNQV